MNPLMQIKLKVFPSWDSTSSETMRLECTVEDFFGKLREKVNLATDQLFDQLFYRDDEGEIINFSSQKDLLLFTRQDRIKKVYLVLSPERIFTPYTKLSQTKTVQVEENKDNAEVSQIQMKVYVKLNEKVIKIIRFEHRLITHTSPPSLEGSTDGINQFKIELAEKLRFNPALLTKLFFEIAGTSCEFYNPNFLVKLNDKKVKRVYVEYKPGALLKSKRRSIIPAPCEIADGKGAAPANEQKGGANEEKKAEEDYIEL